MLFSIPEYGWSARPGPDNHTASLSPASPAPPVTTLSARETLDFWASFLPTQELWNLLSYYLENSPPSPVWLVSTHPSDLRTNITSLRKSFLKTLARSEFHFILWVSFGTF